eukprot:13001496-Heterocapsa_arctica.AAC.1
MTYGHESSTDRGETKLYTLMVQTKEHTTNKQIGYVMFENLENEEDANRLRTTSSNHVNKHHGEQGESVESIMAMGFI